MPQRREFSLSGEDQRQGWRCLAPMDGFTAFPGERKLPPLPHALEYTRKTAKKSQPATVTRKLSAQKLHLITANPGTINQRQILRHVWHIGQRQQLHVALFRTTIALMLIAAPTGRHHIQPA